MMVATIRPGAWNLPVLLHVAGAMALVASVVIVAVAMAAAARGDGTVALTRLGYRTLLAGVLPSYVVMRVAAEWATSKEGVDQAGWVGTGRAIADGGLLVLLVAVYLAFRARRAGESGGPARIVAGLMAVLLVAYVVAIWAMATKPA